MNWKCRFYIWLLKREDYKQRKKFEKLDTKKRVKEIISDLAWYNKYHKRCHSTEHRHGYKSLISAAKYLGLEDHLIFDGNWVELKIELKDEKHIWMRKR